MEMPNADTSARWVSNEASNEEYEPLSEVLFQVLQSNLGGKSSEEIAEYAEKILSEVVEELKNLSANNLAEGIEPAFKISGEETDAYIKVVETKASKLLAQLRERTPDQFEHFCKDVLKELGAFSSEVTGGSNDGGVDFIAFSLPLGLDAGPAPKSSRAFVVGQAKRYTKGKLISENDVRKFLGGAVRRVYQFKKTHIEVGGKTPIVYAFWTTGEFHRMAKEFVKDMGIWYLNGTGLAQLANRVGILELE